MNSVDLNEIGVSGVNFVFFLIRNCISQRNTIIFDSFICLFVYLFLFIYIYFKLILNHHCNIDFASTTRFIKGISNSILGCAVVVNQLTKASSFYTRVY